MKPLALTLDRIGKSRGIRIPATLIRKHGFQHGLVLEDRGHEVALKSTTGTTKLSWEETAREMANSKEDWSDWDCTVADGLDQIPWDRPTPGNATAKRKPKQTAKK